MGPGSIAPREVPCAKGWLLYCLEICSRSPRARDYLQGLKDAIERLGPDCDGLERVYDEHVIAHVVSGERAAEKRRKIRDHLRNEWFGTSSDRYFPEWPVARIHAEGVAKALEASLARPGAPAPITSWWLLDHPEVKMMTMLDDGRVTLLVMTPRPPTAVPLSPASMRHIIMGDAEVWDGSRRIRDVGKVVDGEPAALIA
jgi:hypothetical protein